MHFPNKDFRGIILMYYYSWEMFFDARIYSKQYVHIIPGRLRKNALNSSEERKKRIFKNFTKEKKLIYAYFLDIA